MGREQGYRDADDRSQVAHRLRISWVLGLLYRKWRVYDLGCHSWSHRAWLSELDSAPLCVLYAVTPLVSRGHLGFFPGKWRSQVGVD